jgi:hypothetical protein
MKVVYQTILLIILALALCFAGCRSKKAYILYKDAKYVHLMNRNTFEEYRIKRKY